MHCLIGHKQTSQAYLRSCVNLMFKWKKSSSLTLSLSLSCRHPIHSRSFFSFVLWCRQYCQPASLNVLLPFLPACLPPIRSIKGEVEIVPLKNIFSEKIFLSFPIPNPLETHTSHSPGEGASSSST